MSLYKKVQFIPWFIHTGPIRNDSIGAYDYSGYTNRTKDRRIDVYSQCVDIEARVAYTQDAIQKAYQLAEKDSETLKIFIAPEFLYRGASGAYLHDLINGWNKAAPVDFKLDMPFDNEWPGLFGRLKELVAHTDYKDWIFVLGTAVSASFKIKLTSDKKYIINPLQDCECYNTCLIQRGGMAQDSPNSCHVVRKHHKSPIDFINYRLAADIHKDSTIVPIDNHSIIPIDALGEIEGNCIFQFSDVQRVINVPITFGLEICLDHSGYQYTVDPSTMTLITNRHGRLRNNHQYVDIQLVPSGGMTLVPVSICLLPENADKLKSYAINCDGLSSLLQSNIWGSHVQVWNQSLGNIIQDSNKLVTLATSFNTIPDGAIAVSDSLSIGEFGTINATLLWRAAELPHLEAPMFPCGAGFIKTLDPLEL